MSQHQTDVEIRLALALERIAHDEAERIKDRVRLDKLEKWQSSCSRQAAWWAGVCATMMTAAALIRTFWSDIDTVMRGHK